MEITARLLAVGIQRYAKVCTRVKIRQHRAVQVEGVVADHVEQEQHRHQLKPHPLRLLSSARQRRGVCKAW